MPNNAENASSPPPAVASLPFQLTASTPLRLDQFAGSFVVTEGHVDLFGIAVESGAPSGARRHVLRVNAGGLVAGMPEAGDFVVIVVAGLGAGIRSLPALPASERISAERAALLDGWIQALAEATFGVPEAWPDTIAVPGTSVDVAAGLRLHGGRAVAWVRPIAGELAVLDEPGAVLTAEASPQPVAGGLWLRAVTAARVEVRTTAELRFGEIKHGLDRLHRLAADAAARNLAAFESNSGARLTERDAVNAESMAQAVAHLAKVVDGGIGTALDTWSGDPLAFAFQAVAHSRGAVLPSLPAGRREPITLALLARLTGFGYRQVLLRGEWWRSESGPLIGRRTTDGRPVALLPRRGGGYRLLASDSDGERRVDRTIAAELADQATTLYRPLPEMVRSIGGLAGFALHGIRGDLAAALALGFLSSALAAMLPIATGFLFESAVPRAEFGEVAMVIGGLTLALAGASVFELVKSIALLRLEARMEAALQPSIMQRLLALPVGFFRDYGTGDLTDRVLGVQRIRRLIAGTTVVSLLSGVVTVVSFVVMLGYSPLLAVVSAVLVGLAGLVTAGLGLAQLRHDRRAAQIAGREDGMIIQLIQGIGKLRVAAAEPRLFAVWAGLFGQRKSATLLGRRYANLRATFFGTYPILAMIVLFQAASGLLGSAQQGGLTLGAFLAVNAAFGQLLAAVVGVAGALASTFSAVPLFERLRPILTAAPEAHGGDTDPGPLVGAIEVSHVSFRYAPDAPLVLDDLSLRIEPGQFVAVVGPSGSGKSTLSRLLLGFETPESGDIQYQGQSIGALDASALRRRIGVVLQHARVMSGSIFENITGGLPFTLEDAWEAARMAAVADDIEALPMGMHTLLMEGAPTLSGGQVQRLMIARALIGKPQLLIFDEATSALDNQSQAVVTASLERLHATRLVIAHRLSTVRNADRIYVLDRGRLVEQGGFADLTASGGTFAALTRRQLP